MPESSPTDRLLPCLLDRLTDRAPEATTESADRRTVSMRQYREGVRRDLENLLNARCRTGDDPVALFENVATSVLNFGIPDLTGQTLSGLNVLDLERKIRQAI
ncbi:MAG: type VI secretion system baseplate subunit TssE, partial [Planctomycetes bacterium]|nr:type VI secretion system baseplate subunit TssE [Planctomycetota bacterium]